MPAQVAHWPDVKATAIATGSLKEAAALHEISYEAVRQRASREAWPVGLRVHRQAHDAQQQAHAQIVTASKGAVTRVTPASDAISAALADDSRETRLSLSRAARKMAKESETAPLEQAGDALQVGKLAAAVHGWDRDEGQRCVLAFFSIQAGAGDESPVIDV